VQNLQPLQCFKALPKWLFNIGKVSDIFALCWELSKMLGTELTMLFVPEKTITDVIWNFLQYQLDIEYNPYFLQILRAQLMPYKNHCIAWYS